jgi:hypothetical protein
MKKCTLQLRSLHVVTAFALLASCSNAETTEQRLPERTAEENPPGVARALSLGSQRLLDDGSDGAGRAIRCATALRVTREALAEMSSPVGPNELATIRAIEEEYVRDAVRTGAGAGQSATAVSRLIERQVHVAKSGRGQQAQIAMACINSLRDQPA